MKNLLQFLIRNSVLLLFLLLEVVSFVLLIQNNQYPYSATFSSANRVYASCYACYDNVIRYFRLRSENEGLVQENARLREQITYLQEIEADGWDSTENYPDYAVIPARVVNYTGTQQKNYITINKGEANGVREDMGVVCERGVVGIVVAVSEHYSVVIPIINHALSISCRLKEDGSIGTLQWDGRDFRYAQLMDIGRHIMVREGDTIITSGVSTIFPKGIPVGVVEKDELTDNDSFHNIEVALATDFRRMQNVYILKQNYSEEIRGLEGSIK